MSETEKYVTPDQMRDVVDAINRGFPIDPASVNIDLAVSGSTLTLTLPDGTAKTATLPSGGGMLTPSTTDVLI